MITDASLQLSTAQVVTATAVSTNTIDLGVARDMAPGDELYAIFSVDVSAAAAGAATVTFQIITSAASDLSSPTVISSTDAIGKAELTAGRSPISLHLNKSILAAQKLGQRYLGVQYVVATGPLTTGSAFSCVLTDSEIADGKYYTSGFSVL